MQRMQKCGVLLLFEMPITKTINNYEKSLNSGHQFHQYQQNKQSLFVSPEHKETTTYDVGYRCPGSDMHQNVAGLIG